MRTVILIIVFVLGGHVSAESEFRFRVVHDHWWKEGQGVLTISAQGIEYESDTHPEHSRRWEYADIQDLRIDSERKIRILTYEDVSWQLNRDRDFQWTLAEGEITPEIVRFLRSRLPVPPASAVFTPPSEKAIWSLPVKHRHALGGGCSGELTFAGDALYFSAVEGEHSRMWPVSAIVGIGRSSPYHLRVAVRENSAAGDERSFQFELKRPLDERGFDRLWRAVHEPDSWLDAYARTPNRSSADSASSERRR